MTIKSRRFSLLLLSLLAISFFSSEIATAAASSGHWVGTWAASPYAALNRIDPSGSPQFGSTDATFREIVHVSLGGSAVRVILSNEFGLDPLTIGAAQIALSTGNSEIDSTSAGALTFGGRPTITIPPGALAVSDPVTLKLAPSADVAVSLFLPAQPIQQISQHGFADQTNYVAEGNVVGA